MGLPTVILDALLSLRKKLPMIRQGNTMCFLIIFFGFTLYNSSGYPIIYMKPARNLMGLPTVILDALLSFREKIAYDLTRLYTVFRKQSFFWLQSNNHYQSK